MSDITLSAGVRQNLLSLQNTADLMATTQNRLATGKKVNSALDNPTNFFTASSLQSRSNDLSSLMDAMSNGVKTLEAADNGLTSITKTLESIQSTLRQARQDKSFETTSYDVDLGASATGSEKLSFSGGAVGSSPVKIDLTTNTGGTAVDAANAAVTGTTNFNGNAAVSGATSFSTPGAVTGSTDFSATSATVTGGIDFGSAGFVDASGSAMTFDVAVDGGAAVTVTLATNGGTNSDGHYSASDVEAAINGALTGAGQTATVAASFDASTGGLVLSSASTGTSSDITVSDGGAGDASVIGFTDGAPASTALGADAGVDASGGAISFDVAVDGGSAVTVTLATNGGTNSDGKYSASDITTAINDALTADSQTASVTATIDGSTGGLVVTSDSVGTSSSVTISDGGAGDASAVGFTDGDASATATGGAPSVDASGGAMTFDVAVDGGAAVTVTLATNGGSNGDGQYSADDITSAINDALTADSQTATATASFAADGSLQLASDTIGTASSLTISDGGAGDASAIGFTDGAASSTASGSTPGVDASGGAISFDVAVDGGDAVTVTLATDGGTNSDGNYTADDITTAVNAALIAGGQTVTATASFDSTSGGLTITSDSEGAAGSVTISDGNAGDATAIGVTSGGASATATGTDASYTGGINAAKTVDQLVSEINSNDDLKGKVRASNDDGKLRIENQSTQDLALAGAAGTSGTIDGSASTTSISGNSVRSDFANQFNELRDQLDKLSDDASYNGTNLLRGDNLKITFNETGTSTIDIQTKEGETVNAASLGLDDIDAVDLDSDSNIDSLISTVKDAINTVRSQSSAFGSNLSIVENRQDFTKSMMNTLQTGADNLVLADGNEEAANMLALQTRQQLSSTALSLASQADQAPLRLF